MKFTKNQIIIVGIGGVALILVILLFTGIIPGLRSGAVSTALTGTLNVWGVFDEANVIDETLIASFKAQNPGVEVFYREMDPATYEEDLVNALAAGSGPDLFMVKNTWIPKHRGKIFGIPATSYAPATFAGIFPTVATQDFIYNDSTYALPLYLDTLAVFYNKNIFDNAGIAEPPKTWDDLEALLPKLKKIDQSGRIDRAAIALGTGKNVANAADILSLLMLQDGVQMISTDYRDAQFRNGASALNFYISFANPGDKNYTWNRNLPGSIEAFAQEKTAMLIAYAYQIPEIKERNPFLSFGISPMFQKTGASRDTNYANYWGLAISKQSKSLKAAISFLFTTATDPTASQSYLKRANRPPALRSLIGSYQKDAELGVFTKQTLTARSWFEVDATMIENLFEGMIESVITGQASANRALETANDQVSEVLKRNLRN